MEKRKLQKYMYRHKFAAAVFLLSFVVGSSYLWVGFRSSHPFKLSEPYNITRVSIHRSQPFEQISRKRNETLPPGITRTNGKISPSASLLTLQTDKAGASDIFTEVRETLSLLAKYSQPCKGEEIKTTDVRHLQIKLACMRTSEPCYVWYWDVANWTLVHTNINLFTSSSGRRFCPKPIYGERTAKIVHSDGKVEYPGCINDKYPCAPWPLLAVHYDKKLKMRINTSPCCRKQVLDVTRHMARVFDKYKITYFLVGGAVIGLVRDGGVHISYDTDLDVGVDANDHDKLVKAIPELNKPGCTFKWIDNINTKVKFDSKGRHWYMVGCVNTHCHTGPGIGLYTAEGDKVIAVAPPWTYSANITVPPIRRMFEGMEMSFPKEPEKYLDFVYGKEKWTTPLDCTKHYHEQCTA